MEFQPVRVKIVFHGGGGLTFEFKFQNKERKKESS